MIGEPDPSAERDNVEAPEDAELGRALEAYLADIEAGRPADPARLIAAHPKIAGQLRACLQVMNLADGMVSASSSPSGVRRPIARLDTTTMAPGQSGLTTLGSSSVPNVHLRDLPDESEPLIQPRSTEMPVPNGTSLGRYQLQGEIARGGMGAILKGRDIDLGRDLAIKVLLETHQGNPEIVSRFIEEAQIGGQLQHPGIAPVYELGAFPEPDRRPYFAMKLVRGQTLAALLGERQSRAASSGVGAGSARREDRGTEPPPTGTPSVATLSDLPRFLAIFEQVCQTMAYAHARGVIHRDLKPSNVMVGSFGEVQVMDWGLAKVLPRGGIADETSVDSKPLGETGIMTVRTGSSGSGSDSQAGSVLGTPSYMAPEQARGDVERLDERADVFGLGSILCEVLTGRPPYSGSSREAIRARASRGDTDEALARLDACGADEPLIALARDCLAIEPDHRPRDAGEVARRISAHQAGVQEHLKAAELERVEAQTRAEEAQTRAVVERSRRRRTVALAASVLGLMMLGGGGWVYLARQRAERLAVTTRVVTDALADAERLRGQAQGAVSDMTKWSAAVSAARYARDLLAQGEADDGLHSRVADVLTSLEQEQAAAAKQVAEVERDRKLLDELETIRGSRSEHRDSKRTDTEYAIAFRRFGIDFDQLDPNEAGTQIARRSSPVELASDLDDWALQRRAARGQKDPASWRRLLAAARVADSDSWRATLREQISQGESGRRALRRLADDDQALRTQSPRGLVLLAVSLQGREDRARAERVLQRARRLQPNDFWTNYELGEVHSDIGTLGRPDDRSARPEEAARFYSIATAIRPRCGPAHCNLGTALFVQGKLEESIVEFRESVRLNPKDPTARFNLGNALKAQGKLDEASQEYREVLRLQPNDADAHGALGIALSDQGKLDEAIKEYHEAINLNPNDPIDHNNLGDALEAKGQLDEAVKELHEALRLKPDQAETLSNLGEILARQSKLDEAIAACREAISLRPDLSEAHGNLGLYLARQRKLDQAIQEYREALRLKPDLPHTHRNLGYALRIQGDFTGAIAEFRQARDLAKDDPKYAQEIEGDLIATERQASLAAQLPAVRAGQLKPADATETMDLAKVAHKKKLYGTSARLWNEAFQAQPRLAEDIDAKNRYNAACGASLAGSGQSKEDPPLDDATRARWRTQAVDWLRSDLAAWSKIVDSGPPQARQAIIQTLQHWKADIDLAGLRDAAALAKLSDDEQKACRTLWAEVEALLAKAQAPTKNQ